VRRRLGSGTESADMTSQMRACRRSTAVNGELDSRDGLVSEDHGGRPPLRCEEGDGRRIYAFAGGTRRDDDLVNPDRPRRRE